MRAMKIIVNDEVQELTADQTTVEHLVSRLGLAGQPVAVEVNRRVVPRREHGTHRLQDGDRVEVVTLVGGG
jgi:thiamine biosynthesis protein ThiS